MRTTVDIPDPIYRELKARAALSGCSVKEVIVRSVIVELKRKGPMKKHRVKLPIFESKHPGTLKLTNKQINDILFPF